MAIMIPEKPREFKPESREDIMFSALEKLPDEYYVVHSFRVNKIKDDNSTFESEADFVVFHPQKGLMCIEAKATIPSYHNGAWWYNSGKQMSGGGPFIQAQRSMHAIEDNILEHGMVSVLENCKFLFAVWFPCVRKSNIRNLSLPADADINLILGEEALYDPEPYLEKIFSITEHRKTKTNLSKAQADRVVNEVLCPTFNIAPTANFDTETKRIVFHRLLKEQVAVLNFLDEQRTAAISGAAGTGKTLVALEKAKRHAMRGEKVLFLCFNKYLKNYLAENYANDNIDYYTLPGFACSLCRTAVPDYAALNRILESMWVNSDFPYHHVIVDEGQDFGEDGMAEALDLMQTIIEETTEDGTFYVFYDKLQKVQAKKLPNVLVDADCKMTLYRNCRNTENIAKTSLGPISERAPKLISNCIVGAPAKLHYCSDTDSVLAALDEAIDALHDQGIRNIVILTCKTKSTSILTPHLVEERYPAGKESLFFTTCRMFKGLEAEAVILVDVDKETFIGSNENNEDNVMLFYVGTSRAKLHLDIITQMDSDDCRDVLESLGKEKIGKNTKRDLAKALNAVARIEE